MTGPIPRRSPVLRFLARGSAELFFVFSIVVVVFFAVDSSNIAKELHLSQAQLGLLGGAFSVAIATGQFVFGVLLGFIASLFFTSAKNKR